MPLPNLGPQYDLAARIAALEDTVRRMQANPLAQAFSMTQSDGSVGMALGQDPGTGSGRWIVYQGTTTARDPNTDQHPLLMYLGELVSGGVFVDSGLIMFRPDGSESLVIGNRGVQIIDPRGNPVISTDEYGSGPSEQGLNTPWLPLGQPASLNAAGTGWPNTTSVTLAGVSLLAFPAQHARVTWYGTAYCPTGSAGQVQVGINNGAVGALHSAGAGFTNFTETVSLGTWSWQQMLQFTATAALTSGTGPIYLQIYGVWGCGSGF